MAGSAPFLLEPVDAVTITTLVDNVSDLTLPDEGPAKRARITDRRFPRRPNALYTGGETLDMFQAEHGFAALLTVAIGGRERRILFDTGLSPDAMTNNMRRLSLSPKDAEALVLSHGHWDHTGGLAGLVADLGRVNLPVILHPDFWNRRRLVIPGREPHELLGVSKAAVAGAGFEVIEEPRPSFLLDRALLITGEVPRTTGYEPGLPGQERWDGAAWVDDAPTWDDQAIVLHLRDKGLVVITGCGHAGVVNIIRHARALTGVDRVHAVIGGFHLSGRDFEPIIPNVVAALLELAPEVVVPAHCTGWRAAHAIGAALPWAFVQNAVGTRIELGEAGGTRE